MIWNETKECMSRDEIEHLQSIRLVRLVERVYHNVEFYRKKMQQIGIEPGDIKETKDITKLPFTTKQDLRDNYPFGLFAVPQSEIVRIHASSGTTGKPTVVGYTRRDIEAWQECVARVLSMVGLGKEDRIQVSYGYGLFTGGLGLHYGVENLGAAVVPMSSGNTKKQIMMLRDFACTAIACTPSYLLHLTEIMEEMKLTDAISLRTAICGAEPWSEGMRNMIRARLGIDVYDIYGLSEIMGPGVAAECEYHQGLHLYEDQFLAEIIDPVNQKEQKEGETGELVITTLTKEAIPLLRYRTRDLTSLTRKRCDCKRTLLRLSRFSGRTDDMLIVRGVNIFPGQVEAALMEITELNGNYQLIVDRINYQDTLEVFVEVGEQFFYDEIKELEKLANKISEVLHAALQIQVIVKLVEPKTIVRSEGKANRVIDRRER